jgi:hypothetical protein
MLTVLALGVAVLLLYSAFKNPTGGPWAVIKSIIAPPSKTS